MSRAVVQPIVIGHRGSPGHLPDHTLEGYRLAVEQGADFIEPDLVMTRDGHLIVRHENDLGHTTDISSRFPDRGRTREVDGVSVTGFFSEDFDLKELATVRAVQPFPSRPHTFDGKYRIATFEDVLELRAELSASTGRTIGVYPELKHPTHFAAQGLPMVEPFLAALRRHDLDRADAPVFLQCFERDVLLGVGTQVPKVLLFDDLDKAGADGSPTYRSLLADLPALAAAGIAGIGVHTSHIWGPSGANDLVERAHAAGLKVHVYTFRMEADKLGHAASGDGRLELRRFYELGVDGVFADYPDVAVEVRRSLP